MGEFSWCEKQNCHLHLCQENVFYLFLHLAAGIKYFQLKQKYKFMFLSNIFYIKVHVADNILNIASMSIPYCNEFLTIIL